MKNTPSTETEMTEQFVPEKACAVLDRATGLREWFNSHREAIEAARVQNQVAAQGNWVPACSTSS